MFLAAKWDMGNHNAKSLSVDIGLLIALDLFLLLTIGDFAGGIWCHVLTVIAGIAYFGLLRNSTFGLQAFDLAPVKSDIVKALSLRAPLVGIILAMLTYFWEFLIPVLNVLFIQNLGWTDTEYVAPIPNIMIPMYDKFVSSKLPVIPLKYVTGSDSKKTQSICIIQKPKKLQNLSLILSNL